MKKLLSALLVVAPFTLVGCADRDTYVVQPTSPSAGTVVVPNNQPAPSVQQNTTKVCPQGAVTC